MNKPGANSKINISIHTPIYQTCLDIDPNSFFPHQQNVTNAVLSESHQDLNESRDDTEDEGNGDQGLIHHTR